MKWFFSPKSGDINPYEITIFCCLKSSFECTNGFSMLKNPWSTRIIQKQSLKSADLTIFSRISSKCPWKKSPENLHFVEHLAYGNRKWLSIFKVRRGCHLGSLFWTTPLGTLLGHPPTMGLSHGTHGSLEVATAPRGDAIWQRRIQISHIAFLS
jgi:hypothetical protein